MMISCFDSLCRMRSGAAVAWRSQCAEPAAKLYSSPNLAPSVFRNTIFSPFSTVSSDRRPFEETGDSKSKRRGEIVTEPIVQSRTSGYSNSIQEWIHTVD